MKVGTKFNLAILIGALQILSQSLPVVMSTEKWHKLNDVKIFVEADNKVNWFEAMNECARKNMSLIAIDTAAKSSALTAHLTATLKNHVSLWIGANDLGSEGYFVWSATGKPLEFTNWSDHEPNDGNKAEDCVHFYLSAFRWNDNNCAEKFGFVCEENPFEVSARRKVKFMQNVVYEMIADCVE